MEGKGKKKEKKPVDREGKEKRSVERKGKKWPVERKKRK